MHPFLSPLCKRKVAEKLHPCFAQTRPVPGILYTQGKKETIIADYSNNIVGHKDPRSNSFNWDLLHLTCLTNAVAERMDRPFSELEVWQAIQQLPSEKTLGPDSFTGVFYCCCWNIIKGEVLNASSKKTQVHSLRLMELTSPSSQKPRWLMNPRILDQLLCKIGLQSPVHQTLQTYQQLGIHLPKRFHQEEVYPRLLPICEELSASIPQETDTSKSP